MARWLGRALLASGREAGRGVYRPLAALSGLRARSRCGASRVAQRVRRAHPRAVPRVSSVRPRTLLAVVTRRSVSQVWARGARWQRLARCPERLDPVVNYRGFGRRCHRCCLRHFSLQQGKPGRKGLRPSLCVVGIGCQGT